jgi:chaperonin GroEL (HSP60 family)
MARRILRGGKKDIMEKLTLIQLVELRNELEQQLSAVGLCPNKHLQDFEEDMADRIIEEGKDKYLRKIYNACAYKNKKGEVCGELDCQQHVLNAKGILVCKKSKTAKILHKVISEESEASDID